MPSIDRRTLLGVAATGSLTGLAGCSSSCPDSGEPEPDLLVAAGDGARPFDGPPGADWPAPRSDPANTGYAPDATPPSPPLAVRWRTSLPTTDREGTTDRASQPTVAGDLVVVATGDGVSALEFASGAEAWRTTGVTPAVTAAFHRFEDAIAPPVLADDTAVVAAEDGLVGLDLADGGERWRYEGAGAFGVPAVSDGTTYALAGGDIVAVDVGDGTERWSAPADRTVGLPAVADGTVVVAGEETRAFDAASGEVRWRADVRAEYHPVVADGLVYLGAYEGLHGIDLASGDGRWSFDRGSGRSLSSPVVAPDTLYLVEEPGEASTATFALERGDGAPEPRWCSDVGDGAVTAAAGGEAFGVLAGSAPGEVPLRLVAFADRFGDARWGYRTSDRLLPPAVVDHALVAVDRAGTAVAVGEV